jgi:diguanylate cyclase (GGDEF)-like protein
MTDQVLDSLNMGIVIIDRDYRISLWNNWMEMYGHLKKKDMEGSDLFSRFPELETTHFIRSCQAVFRFGNYVFFSQKLHNHLFPFQATGIYGDYFEYMQQSCTITPVRTDGEIDRIIIMVQDVTENVYMERKLRDLTQQDGLTGIHNRRYLDKRLSEEFTRFKRKGTQFSLLIFDIDDFKKVNDTYGHQFGDRILINLAGLCSTIIRGSDIIARYGGEEFCLILSDTIGWGAMAFAERLRRLVETQTVRYGNEEVNVTISIGIAEINDRIGDTDELLKRADEAMYRAKESGKNRVCLYGDDSREA